MSESAEMYLLRIALLSRDQGPVPISQLAEELDISPVSTNQMCRKLAEQGLVEYLPYKGVTLTAKGEETAHRVVRRRRLWEVFLVEKLGLGPAAAEEVACRFEHVTPDELADRLSSFLGHPTASPQHEPIPPNPDEEPKVALEPLTTLTVGQRGKVVDVMCGEVVADYLRAQGVYRGVVVEVLAVSDDGTLLMETPQQRFTLSRAVGAYIDITPVVKPDASDS